MNYRSHWFLSCALIGCALAGGRLEVVAADPPFWGTVWIDPDIIQPSDWSAYQSISYAGVEPRFVFDRRDNAFSTKSMHLFNASYADGLAIEVQVNSSDFTVNTAEAYALYYADMVGQLPTSMREDVWTMWIHGGGALPFGGGNNNILVHVDVEPTTVPFLEEILFHEAGHTSYGTHDNAPAWRAAQAADPNFISLYARDNPNREDVAESILMWYALRYRNDRLDAATIADTEAAIPNRLAYFDELPFDIAEPPLPGDYNGDGAVDAADYTVWRDTMGSTMDLRADGDGDHAVDGDDYGVWKTNFGAGAGSSSTPSGGALTAAAVPEPTGAVLICTAVCLLAGGRRRERGFEI